MTYGWYTSTYEWHTDDIRVHTSDIQMTYEYIRVTYGWHTSTYEWHTDDIQVHTILGYLPKLKKGLELAFGAYFPAWVFHTNAPYLILYQLTKFQRHILYKISNKMFYWVHIYTIDDVINFKIYLQSSSKNWPREGEWGEVRNKKIWVSREWKELFRWSKKHFS